MNCHQILSGACNAGDKCFAVGSVEGIAFNAYAAGCNIVILADNFERVQIIPGATHGYVKISAIDCSIDTGKIAAAYESKIYIFEPTPVIRSETRCTHSLEYRWVQTGDFATSSHTTTLSWNLEGTRLLTAGLNLQLWKEKSSEISNDDQNVKFLIGGDGESRTASGDTNQVPSWKNIWKCQTATSIYHMVFSPDGTLFATCGRNDRLVKIWCESRQVLFPSKNSENIQSTKFELSFTYVYIAHPRAVTYLSWRKTSKYMPKASVSNILVTSCLDNICRIWIETVLPDDGLINMAQFDPLASQNPKLRTHRHKHRFIQRLKHMKTCFYIRRHVKTEGTNYKNDSNELWSIHNRIPSLPSSCSVHDFHSYGYHITGICPGMHFHLAASINAETDIPLVPSMKSTDSSYQSNLILHWLNNKEMYFTLMAESILRDLIKKTLDEENKNTESEKNDFESKEESPAVSRTKIADESRSDFEKSVRMQPSSFEYHMHTASKTSSLDSLNNDIFSEKNQLGDFLDLKIDCLLRDWHHSPDLLFAVHPIDGSFLIWLVEWLDDYNPGSYRQAQVSFSTRIPSAFPIGDSMTISPAISLYNSGSYPLTLHELSNFVKGCEDEQLSDESHKDRSKCRMCVSGIKYQGKSITGDVDFSNSSCPSMSMVTKHSNGTLNLWRLTFALKTKFTQVLSIAHIRRTSGHRFRVNDITCHPILPLLVSTSHHNLPESNRKSSLIDSDLTKSSDIFSPSGFCSELILWKVDSVGPLSYTGGVNELARINSPEISAYSNVAWIPTLLPSSTLGNCSQSPSACFVASDGENLRVYQAVIDARTLLAELSTENGTRLNESDASFSSTASYISNTQNQLREKFKVVSQQSTARPGCIIELDAISDAKHDWQNTQFLHVFEEQLITGEQRLQNFSKEEKGQKQTLKNLNNKFKFVEKFFIIIIEKTTKGSTIHMWQITMSSMNSSSHLSEMDICGTNSSPAQNCKDSYAAISHVSHNAEKPEFTELPCPNLSITTQKVCMQDLPLPEGVDVVHAAPAAGHLSSSSIYPACFAPYIIVTACSDSISRFWKCGTNTNQNSTNYVWSEWKMFAENISSQIEVPGQPLNISVAYSGRVACAYKYGKSFTRANKGEPEKRFINLCVGIYECESSGGSEWLLEDTIHLKNIFLPRMHIDQNIDLSYVHGTRLLQKKQRLNQMLQTITNEDNRNTRCVENAPELTSKASSGLLAVPSFSTLQSLRKSIAENGNTCPLTQKHLVQLDWVSKEDGSHILTVAVGSKIFLYTPVSSDIAQANIKAMKESRSGNRPLLRKASSLAQNCFNDEIRWMKLRQIDLVTSDGLPPLPMQISWVREGILVVAMDSEMHVYSQWKPRHFTHHSVEDMLDSRNLRDGDLRFLVNENSLLAHNNAASLPLMNKMSSNNLQYFQHDKRKRYGSCAVNFHHSEDGMLNIDYMPDFGLFNASRIACPVLPQYHPKQLMELLNCGKISWVKAILAHLVRCMSGSSQQREENDEEISNRQRSWSRSRTLSISFISDGNIKNLENRLPAQIPEELMLDYAEIASIPPLPLWILLCADEESVNIIGGSLESNKDYNELFEPETLDDNLDDILEEPERIFDRKFSTTEKQAVSHFGPRQGQLLSRLLTHTHLPGLSSLDQMHLLALADTVANCNSDFSEKIVTDVGKSMSNRETVVNSSTESLDDCGLRFLLAMKHFTYLLRCLPLNQRPQFQKRGIGTSNIVWAFHSESEEELLNLIPSFEKDIKWSTLRELGAGYWLRNTNSLRLCVERLAKCAYQSKQDPLDAALYYLALRKKSIVWGLFRSKHDEKMTSFFSNNFSEDRWRKAALKNAFVLLGKQRFEHAVAFFLLANSLNDALEVCLNKLEDFQLALVVARLYEGDIESNSSIYKKLLLEHILGFNSLINKFDTSKAHPDPFLRSMAYWIIKKHQESLNTLLVSNVGVNHSFYKDEDPLKTEQFKTPNVFNFYTYLRSHPLLIRQNLATSAQEKKISNVILCGFSYTGNSNKDKANEKLLQIEDSITMLERKLYFATAHAHYKAGCPILALEVLSKLPTKIEDCNLHSGNGEINNGVESNTIQKNKMELDQNSHLFTESNSLRSFQKDFGSDFEICWNNRNIENEEKVSYEDKVEQFATVKQQVAPLQVDVMAQQLKFVACLKILMEELSTLATGFEVDGGQLRYQLYVWLEKEVGALKKLCNYYKFDLMDSDLSQSLEAFDSPKAEHTLDAEKTTLLGIILQEKQDFEAKVKRAIKRKQWLKGNETLLRTLLTYCSLHGASGGGLASVRMELVLLLQELQQEKLQQQLLSPLPFPSTLPLLSACVAGNKTVVADPIKYIQSQVIDMLKTAIEISPFPVLEPETFCEICILRDLGIALSSCIYQSLCDSDSFIISNSKMNGFPYSAIQSIGRFNASYECSYLIGNANAFVPKRKFSVDDSAEICTTPPDWPGVASLRSLLSREKDEDMPKLNVLLLECFVAVYLSLTIYAFATCDCRILYRLVGHKFTEDTWSKIFGGGMKKLIRKPTIQCSSSVASHSVAESAVEDAAGLHTIASLSKQRINLNTKILGQGSTNNLIPTSKEDKKTLREQFVSPDMSMVSFLLSKPRNSAFDDYDSDEAAETESESEDDTNSVENNKNNLKNKARKKNTEHCDPTSLSWCILRLVLIKLTSKNIRDIISVAGIDMTDLPVLSPLCHEVLRCLDRWQNHAHQLLMKMDTLNEEYISDCLLDSSKEISSNDCGTILKNETPFIIRPSTAPIRRLWNFLILEELVQDTFKTIIFGKKIESSSKILIDAPFDTDLDKNVSESDNIRIIHKGHESILAFCVNNHSPAMISFSNPREIQELDISLLLDSPNWCEDECDYDMLNIYKETEAQPAAGYVALKSPENPNSESIVQFPFPQQSGRGTSLVLRHRIDNIRRMSSHPLIPLYITGSQDGAVQIWEWGHQQMVCMPRPPGAFAKVTRCKFSEHGNKFGIGDGDGNLSLWQAALASQRTKAFFNHQCHAKGLSDFVFLGSCSLLSTGGQSSENKNICIWDTLLPQKKACIATFSCHDQGASSLVFAPQHQLLISTGKKGDVCIFDLRQRTLKHRFQAHENAIKCIALDPHEEYFATGSTEGDIKIWSMDQYSLIQNYFGEHAKNSFFKHVGQGVSQIHVDENGRLFSCGSDGCIKVRQLNGKEAVIQSFY